MANKIQGRYDELEGIVNTFSEIGQDTRNLHEAVQRVVARLHDGDWKGIGAAAFFTEMEEEIFPSLYRLRDAMELSAHATREMIHIFREAEEDAARLFRFFDDLKNPGGGLTVQGPVVKLFEAGHFDANREAYVISAATEVADHPFESGDATALKYDIEINGQTVTVYMAKDQDATVGNYHTIDQVAAGLASLPQSSRDAIVQVNVEPGLNPDDAFWQEKYNNPNHRSYMTAGADGIVAIYPSKNPQPQEVVDGSLIHETGHILSKQAWGNDYQGDNWKPWRDAMADDGFAVSQYSHSSGSPGEDFSEALVVYQAYKGTPQEAAMREKYASRFALIDKLLNPSGGAGGAQ